MMSSLPASTYSTMRAMTSGFVVHICGGRALAVDEREPLGVLLKVVSWRRSNASFQLWPKTAERTQPSRERRAHLRAAS